MDKIAIAFGGAMLFAGGILMLAPLGALCGGIAGWVVGIFFGDTILNIAGQIGIHGVTMFQIGVFLGFVGSFLKTKVTAKVEKA